ncbi:guanine deaminase [Streptomyces sp. NBC_00083]|uniref:guanine deaminase n=1 Tax=Streptomyces sp. NBC_00083 TaxID=2975647 RepID=UPI0022587560|nr:guanine deaminase [Streptomyces sp. NBC_00083]MCX5386879.1 guanine deaminase [Streptomyces sp. NBC_00083]
MTKNAPHEPKPHGAHAGTRKAYRAAILDFIEDPGQSLEPKTIGPDAKMRFFPDGILVVSADGIVEFTGEWSEFEHGHWLDSGRLEDYRGCLITPGFIDTHIHYVQMDAIAGYGDQVLQWLEKYIWPAEAKFEDLDHAREIARFFLDTLLSAGTTTGLVLSSTPWQSAEGFFQEALKRNMRMLTGKVVQDQPPQNVVLPENQFDRSVADARRQNVDLIEKWHGKGRLLYAVTPRFAMTCSDSMLQMCSDLMDEYDERGKPLWLQTHLSENLEEESIARRKFDVGTYTEAYGKFGLLRERALYAHCVSINGDDRELIAKGGATIAHCPTSNFFLGSGVHNLVDAIDKGIRVGMGTDCGGGTNYSILHTLGAAYKAQAIEALNHVPEEFNPPTCAPRPEGWTNPYPKLTAWRAFYLATLGGARALYLDKPYENNKGLGGPGIGSFRPGNEADFVVLDLAATPVIKRRIESVDPRDVNGDERSLLDQWHEKLFVLMTLADDRVVKATYIMGRLAYEQQAYARERWIHAAGPAGPPSE